MRNEQLFDEFIAFCDGQPKDKEIDHSNWESCAVGDFARSKGLDTQTMTIFDLGGGTFEVSKDVHIILRSLGIDPLIPEQRESALYKFMSSISNECRTYGEFTKMLKQHK